MNNTTAICQSIIDKTVTSILAPLNKLVADEVYRHFEDAIQESYRIEQERKLKLTKVLDETDPNWGQLVIHRWASNDFVVYSEFDIRFRTTKPAACLDPFRFRLAADGRLYQESTVTGVSGWTVSEEIQNAVAIHRVVENQILPWLDQFKDNGKFTRDSISKACAFSPLFRAHLKLPSDFKLKPYLRGPRMDYKPMSPELAAALTTSLHLQPKSDNPAEEL